MTSDDSKDLELEKIANTLVHASDTVKKTFYLLLRAFVAHTTIADTSKLYTSPNDGDEDVRSRVARLRAQLSGTVLFIPGIGECELEIPQRTPYHLQLAKTFHRSLVWNAHVHSATDVLIHTYERLFFRYQEAVYIRKLTVNQSSDKSKEEIADLLKCNPSSITPTMHYVSSGEVNAAIVLQNFFVKKAHKAATLSTGDAVSDAAMNRILMGSARLDASEMVSHAHERFRIVEQGVRTTKRTFTDKDGVNNRRIVHVVLSRRSGGGVETVFEGSHGRAIEGLAKALIAEESSLCKNLLDGFRETTNRLPDFFQAVFRVELVSGPNLSVRASSGIEIVAFEAYNIGSAATTAR